MIENVIRRAIESHIEDVWTALPARVDSYDATKQQVDVTPMTRRPLATEEDDPTGVLFEDVPQIHGVPVMFPRGSGDAYSITWPLAAGDFVLLVVATWDPSGWRADGVVSDPGFVLAHYLGGCFAIPGLSPDSTPINATAAGAPALVLEAPEIRLTKEASGAHDYIALAKKVEDAFKDIVTATKSAIAGCTGQNPAQLNALSFDVGSAKVKAK